MTPSRRRWASPGVVLVVGLLGALGGVTARADSEWQHERRDDTLSLIASRLEVVDPLGDVRLRAGRAGELRVVSNVQWRPGFRPEIVIEPGARGGSTLVDVVPQVVTDQDGERTSRVDLTIIVPPSTSVSVETTDGLVEAKGLSGALDVTTDRGDIRLRTSGPVRTRTAHGATSVLFRALDWVGTSRLESTTGAIRVDLPKNSHPIARIETRGEITTDYSIVISRSETSRLKTGTVGGPQLPTGDLGRPTTPLAGGAATSSSTTPSTGGGPTLILSSYSGPIKLLETLAPASD